MYYRSFRAIVLFSAVACLVILPGLLITRAMTPSARAITPARNSGRSFQPTGHGVAKPQKVSTTSIPQIHISQSVSPQSVATSIPKTVASKQTRSSSPSNIVKVSAPGSTDPSAKQGLSFSNQPKPDANGAGGLDNYMETTYGGLGIYTRSGTQQYQTSYNNWFGVARSVQFFDPNTTWDDTGDRFIFSVMQIGSNNLYLSVAQQTSALGNYCNYTFTFLPGHDFDHLGVDADGIYFTANLLNNSGQVVGNELFFVSRTAMENCQNANYNYWTNLSNPDGSIAQSIAPASEDGSTPGIEYLVNSIPTGACRLTLWELTSNANLLNTTVPTQCYSPPPPAKQKGSTALIGTDDCSITQASLVNGLLTVDTPGSYDWGDGNGQVGIVEWYVINPGAGIVANQGAFGTPGYWLFYPSTITTPNGNRLFVYNASGPSIYPSVWYVNQTLKGATALANGTSYYDYARLHVASWGDYQSAWPDTSSINPNSVWITGEYSTSPSSWGTKFDLITP